MRLNKKQKNDNHYNVGPETGKKIKKPDTKENKTESSSTERTENEKRYDIDAGLS